MSASETSPLVTQTTAGYQATAPTDEPNGTPLSPSARSLRAEAERTAAEKQRRAEIFALYAAMAFCFIFMIVEVVAGYLAHSLAIFTDAAHLFTDVGAYMLSIFALYAASREKSRSLSYGWHRAEVLGTLVSIFTIWALVAIIVWEAISRIITMYHCAYADKKHRPDDCIELQTKTMVIVGCLGLLVNLGCAVILTLGGSHGHSHFGGSSAHGHSHDSDHGHEHGHSHHSGPDTDGSSHGHSHGEENELAHGHGTQQQQRRRKTGFAINAAFLHALGDCIQSVGVIIAGSFAYFFNTHTYGTEVYKFSPYNLADPISSILFAVVTLFTTKNLLQLLFGILMEATPPGIDADEIHDALAAVPGVRSVHDLHIWSIASDRISLSVHIVADNHAEALERAQDILEHRYGITHTTVQVDPEMHGDTRCMSNICS